MRFDTNSKSTILGIVLAETAAMAQAHLYIDVYPSQDNPNQNLWFFGVRGGDPTANYGSTIQSGGNYHARDSFLEDFPLIELWRKPQLLHRQ